MEDDKTRIIRRPKGDELPPPTRKAGRVIPIDDNERTIYNQPRPAANEPEGTQATRLIRPQSPSPPPDEGKTVLVRPSGGSRSEPSQGSQDGPVVGWLVVVEGPGKGESRNLGYGVNAIGRDASNRVRLDFGDAGISRVKQAMVTYDSRNRAFYVQHGESNNLSYLNNEPVLAPAKLSSRDRIRIGNDTELLFIPLCGSEFEWEA